MVAPVLVQGLAQGARAQHPACQQPPRRVPLPLPPAGDQLQPRWRPRPPHVPHLQDNGTVDRMQELLQKIHADVWNRNFVQGYVSNRSCKEQGCIHKGKEANFYCTTGARGSTDNGTVDRMQELLQKIHAFRYCKEGFPSQNSMAEI
ncbi:hypothetical protein VPH35_106067 [Triticum aestivum]